MNSFRKIPKKSPAHLICLNPVTAKYVTINKGEPVRPEAMAVLKRYYNELVERLADDVVDNDHSFAVDQYGPADEMIERYSHKLNSLVSVLKNIEHSNSSTQKSRVRHQYRVATVVDAGEGLEDAVNKWLADNPTVGVQSVSIDPNTMPSQALVLYVKRIEHTIDVGKDRSS